MATEQYAGATNLAAAAGETRARPASNASRVDENGPYPSSFQRGQRLTSVRSGDVLGYT
jgi:hypothetical protein